VDEAHDFWLSCGHHLLDRDAGRGLVITDDFLRAYLARPELAPPEEACKAERDLHKSLLADPRRPVPAGQIAAIADSDARENWQVMVELRDLLARHRTIEAAYLDIVRRKLKIPHIFLNQIVHVILRNVLDGCDDVFVLRAAESFFRAQKLTLHEGSLVAADEETIAGLGNQPVSPLVSMLGLPPAAEIAVLSEENAGSYWQRSDRFDMALDLTAGRRGLAALGIVAERWIAHLLGVKVSMEPLIEVRDVSFTWYVGLDAEATRLGDALWKADELVDADRSRLVGLYRLTFADPSEVVDKLRGEPVYVIAAMTTDKVLRLKPQNLTTGLPIDLHRTETANYLDNLQSGNPQLWVVLRPTGSVPPYEVIAVTADPAEGEAFTEAGNDLVETVPMPGPIVRTLEAFIAEHHVERPFFKRQRDEAGTRRGRKGRPGGAT
jgi:hypothetical protein